LVLARRCRRPEHRHPDADEEFEETVVKSRAMVIALLATAGQPERAVA
jgi:hypothetical protein